MRIVKSYGSFNCHWNNVLEKCGLFGIKGVTTWVKIVVVLQGMGA